jgi:hypothetical protein
VVRYVGGVASCGRRQARATRRSRRRRLRAAPVVSISDAVLPGAPTVWPEASGNIGFQFNRGEIGPVEAAIRGAAHVVECELVNNRVVAAPLETRGALGEFDASTGRLHLTASAAGAHGIRDPLADSVFRIAREKLRVSIPTSAAASGMKNVLYPGGFWCCGRRAASAAPSSGSGIVAGISRARAWRDSVVRAVSRSIAMALPGARHKVFAIWRLCLHGSAGRADHGDGERDGQRRHPLIAFRTKACSQHDASRRLSRRERPGELPDRALHRHRRRRVRNGCAEVAAQQHLSPFPHQSAMGLSVGRAVLPMRSITLSPPRRIQGAPEKLAQAGRLLASAIVLSRNGTRQPMRWRKCVSVRRPDDLMVGTFNGQGHGPYAQIAAGAVCRRRSGFGRAIRTISTVAAGMAERAPCIKAAPRCCSRPKA